MIVKKKRELKKWERVKKNENEKITSWNKKQ